jgi:hypothetical protein
MSGKKRVKAGDLISGVFGAGAGKGSGAAPAASAEDRVVTSIHLDRSLLVDLAAVSARLGVKRNKLWEDALREKLDRLKAENKI